MDDYLHSGLINIEAFAVTECATCHGTTKFIELLEAIQDTGEQEGEAGPAD